MYPNNDANHLLNLHEKRKSEEISQKAEEGVKLNQISIQKHFRPFKRFYKHQPDLKTDLLIRTALRLQLTNQETIEQLKILEI